MGTRYEVRWSNGYWKLFDTHWYCSAEIHFLRSDAIEAANWLNSRASRSHR